jgi:hypothetical protein
MRALKRCWRKRALNAGADPDDAGVVAVRRSDQFSRPVRLYLLLSRAGECSGRDKDSFCCRPTVGRKSELLAVDAMTLAETITLEVVACSKS